MAISNPTPRPFQVHLSTAIWLSLAAGVILCLNINGPRGKFIVEGVNDGNREVDQIHGWPLHPEYMTEAENIKYNGFGDWTILPIIFYTIDAFVAFALLFTIWFVCERRIRRQESQPKT